MVSVLCAVCGSCGGRVERRPLLSNCPGAPTLGRLLALRDVMLGFLSGSKRARRLDRIPGRSFACLVWSTLHQGPLSSVSAQLPFSL